ncbi:hypothetical protein [Sanguibacter massiliensis]|uniref:hypothetical protein n=1 Tax=Sanguibacter massiliensis TaxID=1973217 RepID=UPI00101AE308|nr:hypothetical protein [Sanguibacter massiliensis]
MSRKLVSVLVATTASVALFTAGLPAANAAEDPTESTARLIADVAPDQGEVLTGVAEADGIEHLVGDVQVSVPVDATEPIAVRSTDDPSLDWEINLPSDLGLDGGTVAADGTIVYEGAQGVDAAVQVLEDGSVRLQTVIPDADAQHEFTYAFGEGIAPRAAADGSIELVKDLGLGVLVVGRVAPAWAVDSSGASVDTTYRIDGTALVQTVTPDASTAYPIVADPTYGHSYGIPTIYLSKSETRSAQDTQVAQFLCGAAGLAIGPILSVLCAGNAVNISEGAKRAVKANGCAKILVAPMLVSTLTYKRNCR